jgi:hypothetical protein
VVLTWLSFSFSFSFSYVWPTLNTVWLTNVICWFVAENSFCRFAPQVHKKTFPQITGRYIWVVRSVQVAVRFSLQPAAYLIELQHHATVGSIIVWHLSKHRRRSFHHTSIETTDMFRFIIVAVIAVSLHSNENRIVFECLHWWIKI